MCGILFIQTDNGIKLEKELVETNFNKMKPRGPDDSNLLFFNRKHSRQIGDVKQYMGFHRLSINGLDAGSNQPLVLDEVYLVCNGEIYNHKELQELYDIKCKSNSDCEIILHLYKKFGVDFVNLLDGVFSFVLLDHFEHQIIVARDPIGVRPLFYQKYKGTYAFASEGKTISGLNFEESGYKALFKTRNSKYGVRQFPAGCVMKLSYNMYDHIDNEELTSYLDKNYYSKVSKYNVSEEKLVIDNIRSMLDSAVEKRLMSDRPIGCLLSGGVDSSIVAALLASKYNKMGKKIKTFSIGFNESTDIKYARIVAKHIGSEHHEVILNYETGISRIQDVIRDIETYDITTIRASVGMYLLSEYISNNFEEIVIFSGEGSDEIFGGYLYFHYAPTSQELEQESTRLVKQLPWYDVLRADRCTASHGLELRVPFLDKEFVRFCLSISGDLRKPQNNFEKYYLRKAFEDLLPSEIIWRRKEGFSDGVGGLTKPWYEWIQESVEAEYPDNKMIKVGGNVERNVGSLVKGFPSKEAWYYNYVFKEYYGDVYVPISKYWMPKWQESNDPSGRKMRIFEE